MRGHESTGCDCGQDHDSPEWREALAKEIGSMLALDSGLKLLKMAMEAPGVLKGDDCPRIHAYAAVGIIEGSMFAQQGMGKDPLEYLESVLQLMSQSVQRDSRLMGRLPEFSITLVRKEATV